MPTLLGLRPASGEPITITQRVAEARDAGTLVSWVDYWGGPDNEPIYWQDRQGRLMWTNLRFTGLTIPRGAPIVSATLRLWARHSFQSAASLGEDKYNDIALSQEDSAVPIGGIPDFKMRMNNVGDSVRWYYPATTAGQPFASPDLAALVQAIVNRPGWPDGSGGNLLFFTATDENAMSNMGNWIADPQVHAFSSQGTQPEHRPELEVTYLA